MQVILHSFPQTFLTRKWFAPLSRRKPLSLLGTCPDSVLATDRELRTANQQALSMSVRLNEVFLTLCSAMSDSVDESSEFHIPGEANIWQPLFEMYFHHKVCAVLLPMCGPGPVLALSVTCNFGLMLSSMAHTAISILRLSCVTLTSLS